MKISVFRHEFGKRLFTVCTLTFFLGGCSMDDNKAKVSDDKNALQKIVEVPAKMKTARWEIFQTPEYTGGVPGPTDYMTLVAEIELPDVVKEFPSGPAQGSVYIVPEAARPWISGDFRSILEKNKNAQLDLSTTKDCHAYTAKLKQTGNPVSGFACTKADRVFLYLSLL